MPKLDLSAHPYPVVTADQMMFDTPLAYDAPTSLPEPYPEIFETETPADLVMTAAALEPTPIADFNPDPTATPASILTYGFRVVNEFPHDRGSFVQGLVVDGEPNTLLEGSGLWGESSLRRVDLQTGEVQQVRYLPDEYFGEGITLFDGRIIQLTWQSGQGFVYESSTFDLIGEFSYAHEGWGITHDGEQLIVSDGTDTIRFWDPETFQETSRIQVYDDFGPVSQLNELEFIHGEIFANVWQTDLIVRIDPETGQVIGRIDLTGLLANEDRIGTESVLNGIAYNEQEDRLYVTGKRWPKIYEIELTGQLQ